MAEGYDCTGDGDCPCSWLDELLCEYVDGTMDPAVRAAFEECLSTDPVLAQQVERLRRTRTLLCHHGGRVRAPQDLQARVRRQLAWEMVYAQPPSFSQAALRLGAFVAAGSVVAAVVMAGLLVGATWLTQEADPLAGAGATPPPAMQQEFLPGLQPAAMTPLRNGSLLGMPAFDEQPAATPLLLTQPSSRMPEVFLNRHLQGAVLQRTGGAP